MKLRLCLVGGVNLQHRIGVPDYNHTIKGPQTLFYLFRPLHSGLKAVVRFCNDSNPNRDLLRGSVGFIAVEIRALGQAWRDQGICRV